jgi:hypothetical protein
MHGVIDSILSDFQQRELPALVRREASFPDMEGKVSVNKFFNTLKGKGVFCWGSFRGGI